ncbi:tetratricopeptide repeat protein [soil metagenome]
MSTTSTKRTRKQVTSEARIAALDGRWEEAIAINRDLIQRDPKDTDAHNRLGRALLEFRDYNGAYEAYSNALKSDLANLIARRNLRRLELLRAGDSNGSKLASSDAVAFPRTNVFIEEVGKTWVTEVTNPAPTSLLAGIYAGQKLELSVEDGRLIVSLVDGTRVGEIERKTGERVIELIGGGNVYEVYALGLTAASLRVILRELYRDPSQLSRVSFPRQITETRAYLRERDLLRQRDESDFYVDDDEDGDDDLVVKAAREPDDDDQGEDDAVDNGKVEVDMPVVEDEEADS